MRVPAHYEPWLRVLAKLALTLSFNTLHLYLVYVYIYSTFLLHIHNKTILLLISTYDIYLLNFKQSVFRYSFFIHVGFYYLLIDFVPHECWQPFKNWSSRKLAASRTQRTAKWRINVTLCV